MDKGYANTDVTYCEDTKCTKKCWRHKENWKFDQNLLYWFQATCKEAEYGKQSN